MTKKEREDFLDEHVRQNSVTVSEFIKKLEQFDENSKLCFVDCVEGCKYDLTPIKKSDLGKAMFSTVKERKNELVKSKRVKNAKEADDFYVYVDDEAIVII